MIKIFSERYQENIIECHQKDEKNNKDKNSFEAKSSKNYENFFGFDIYDNFFKGYIIKIIFKFNEPIIVNGFYNRYDKRATTINVIKLVEKKLKEKRFFFNYLRARELNEKTLEKINWENMFDVIETQHNLLSKGEKEVFSHEINIFLKENKIPWIMQEGIITKRLIRRNDYFDKLVNVENVPDIKIITGIRRSGKSFLLNDFCSSLDPNEINIIRINLNFEQYKELRTFNKLDSYIRSKFNNEKKNYLIIDEIQECNNFERIIYSLREEQKFNIFLSGSNAFLDIDSIGSLFGGRYYNMKIYPFSFKEFNTYFNFLDPIDSFDKYVIKGGMSGSYLYNNITDSYNYINEIFKKTIFKDIINKFNIENKQLLAKIVDYLMDNIGNKISTRKIADYLKINAEIVNLYIDYLCKSFLFYPFKSYDIKGKKYLEIKEENKKYYLVDVSFRFANIGTKDEDRGRIYENIVAIELLRRGYEVYVGILEEKEIDFVAIKNGYKNYFQVSDNISDPKTFKREVDSLLSIRDAYPKTLIARTKNPEWQHEGIRIIDIGEWLNNNDK